MRKSIGTQLFTYILIGTLISLLSVSGFFYKVLEQRARGAIESTLHTQVVMVENEIKQVEQQLQDIAATTRSLQQNGINDSKTYQDVILSLFEKRSSIITAFGFGQTSRAILSDREWFWPYYRINHHDNRDMGTPLPAPHEDLRYWDVSEDHYETRDYYLDPLKKGRNYWIEPYSWHGFTMTTFTGPIRDLAGQIIGIVGMDVSLDAFEAQIDHPVVSGKGNFAILSGEGNLLAYPAEPDKSKALASYDDFPGLAKLWPQMNQDVSGLLLQENTFWAYRRIPETGWTMIAAVPQAVVVGPVFKISAIGTLGAMAILAGISYLFIVRLKKRLDPIVEECKELIVNDAARNSPKNEATKFDGITKTLKHQFDQLDELDVLAISFGEMSQQLQSSIEDLDKRVRERTIDLERAKDEAEAAKDQANAANEAKSNFLANMSHELRTPLNGILGYAQILRGSKSMTPKEKDGVDIINRSGNHLLTLINDILDLSKIESRKMDLFVTSIDFQDFLRDVAEICRVKAQQKNIHFEILKMGNIPSGVIGDEKRLRQVLINLLSNAIKFTQEGKVLFQIRAKRIEPSQTGTPAVYQLEFRIEDSGIGISSSHLERIFKPFEQVKGSMVQAEGTGLGLAISQKMVNMMGGELAVESELGEGSTFSFSLALPEVEINQSPHEPECSNIIGFKGTIKRLLLIDDRWENRAVLTSCLEPLGFDLIEACDGEEGLAAALTHQPDLIITDISMPKLDGLGMIKQLRQHPHGQTIPIFVSSASVFITDQQRSLEAGGTFFLPKPVQLPTLLQALEEHLNLTWLYQDNGDPDDNHSDKAAEESLALPPIETLEKLLKLSRSGLINNLTIELEQIEANDIQLSTFSQQIRDLAKSFQLKEIQEQLQEYLDEASSIAAP